jgi:RNA polymerase sigma-70 factor (ECF subfamily)
MLTETDTFANDSCLTLLENDAEEHAETDASLLEKIRIGDEAAMAVLYDRYSANVFRSALRVLRDISSAEDVLQDVFMMIWRRPEVLDGYDRGLLGWMVVVGRNRAYDLVRCQQRRPSYSIENVIVASPRDYAMESEHGLMGERVAALIHGFPEETRMALEMAFYEDMTHPEIAKKMGMPLGTVKTRIRKGLLRLREELSWVGRPAA